METKIYQIEGMTCDQCKEKIEKHLLRLKEIAMVNADILNGELCVTGKKIDDEIIKKLINGLGYRLKNEVG